MDKVQKAGLDATLVESVVAGTNVTVDASDPANPVVSAAGGGGGGGSTTLYKPPFAPKQRITGELAGTATLNNYYSIQPNEVKIDYIFFPTQTTIDKIYLKVSAASGGGTLHVGLHPLMMAGRPGPQDFVNVCTVSGASTAVESYSVGIPWVVDAGWYAIAMWTDTSITNVCHAVFTSDGDMPSCLNLGPARQLYDNFNGDQEYGMIYLRKSDYDTSPDLSAYDLNDPANFHSSTGEGTWNGYSSIPILGFGVMVAMP